MRTRIIITEQKITKGGEIKLFQIRLPKNCKRIVAVGCDIRVETELHYGGLGEIEESGDEGHVNHGSELQWEILSNPYAGQLVLQSMEKANIFFYDHLWVLKYNDSFGEVQDIESFDAFSIIKKPEPKKVEVPCDTTIINALYRDSLGINEGNVTYFVKVLVWIEYDENVK